VRNYEKKYIALACILGASVLSTSIVLSATALAFSANNKTIEGPKGDKGDEGPKGDKGDKGDSALTAWSNTILPSEGGKVIVNVGSATVGTDVTFTFIPDEGSRLVSADVYKGGDLTTYHVGSDGEIAHNALTLPMVENGYVVKGNFDSDPETGYLNGGDGSRDYPYLVGEEDIDKLSDTIKAKNKSNTYAYYKLEKANTKITNWPIGLSYGRLYGSFDFNGASFENSKSFVFCYIRGTAENPGKVSNLTINNPGVSSNFGAALAYSPDGSVTVENVHINGGTATGSYGAGSFFGIIQKSDNLNMSGVNTIDFVNCSSSLDLTGAVNTIAGFVGPYRISSGTETGFKMVINVDKNSKYTGKLSFVNPSSADLDNESDYVIPDDWYGPVYENCEVKVEDADKLENVTSRKRDDYPDYTIYNYKNYVTLTKTSIYNTTDGKAKSDANEYKTEITPFKTAKVDGAVKATFSITVGVTKKNLVSTVQLEELTATKTEDGKEYFIGEKAKTYKIGLNNHFFDQNGNEITTDKPEWNLTAYDNVVNYAISEDGNYLMLQGPASNESAWKKEFGLYGAEGLITQYDKNENIIGQTSIYFAGKSSFADID